jgi:hypothetical protein
MYMPLVDLNWSIKYFGIYWIYKSFLNFKLLNSNLKSFNVNYINI